MNRDRARCSKCAGLGVVEVIDDILRAGLADPFPALAPAPCPICKGRGWFGEVEPEPQAKKIFYARRQSIHPRRGRHGSSRR